VSQVKAIILADGRSSPEHMEDRHFVEIGGEELLPRIIRQFSEFASVEVAASDPNIADRVDAPTVAPKDRSDKIAGLDMILKGLDLASRERNLIVLGDVYFSDEAISLIREGNGKTWAVYGRSKNNDYKPYGEPFVFEVKMKAIPQAYKALEVVLWHWATGGWDRRTPWEWYFEMEGLPYHIRRVNNIHTGEHWVEIDDHTDDVDYEKDIIGLQKAVAVYEKR